MPVVPVSRGPVAQLGGLPNVQAATPQFNAPDVRLGTPTLSTRGLSTPQVSLGSVEPMVLNPNARAFVPPKNGIAAQQAIQVGSNLSGVAKDMAEVALRYQAKVNAAVVDDALNGAREQARTLTWGAKDASGNLVGGYKNLQGYDAIKRPGDKSLDAEVAENFDRTVRGIAKTKITNLDQQRAFAAQIGDLRAQLTLGAMTHQSEQFNHYYTSVYENAITNQTADFALVDPGDIEGQKAGIQKLEQAVTTLAAHRGDSAQAMDVGLRAARSAAVSTLFDKTVEAKKYTTAQALLNQWGDKIDPPTATKMKSALDGHVAIQVGEQLGMEAWRGWAQPSFDAALPDRAFNVMLDMETGTKHVDAAGKVMRSPKGAGGVAQLMPGTAKEMAAELGRPELADIAFQPTKQGQAANLLIGKAYFNKLLGQYKGDMTKAMAAYNAGPGAVQDALGKARTEGGDWRSYLPAETRSYISRGLGAVQGGQGVPAKPSKQALYDQVDARTDDPEVRKAAYSAIDRRFAAADYDEREQQDAAHAQAIDLITRTGGDINAITPELRARMKPEAFTSLQGYAKNLADGGFTVTKPEAYFTVMNPENLRKMTLNQLMAVKQDLSEQDWNTARKAWDDVHSPQPSKGPDSLDMPTLDGLIDTRLQYTGINTAPKKDDAEDMARLGAVRQFAHQYVLDRQRQMGKKIETTADMQAVVNELFTKSQGFKTTFLGATTGRGKLNVMTATVNDLPSDTRNTLKDQLKRHLGRDATDAEVLQAYFRSQFYTGTGNGGTGR